MRVFVTGFGPFLDTQVNPSAILAETSGRPFQILPVSYASVGAFLAGFDASPFDAILMLGVANKRKLISPELFGRNHRGDTPDVEGEVAAGLIEDEGPLLVQSTLWSSDLLASVLLNPRCLISEDAGTYLCNDIAYRAVRRWPSHRVGFLQVPPFEAIPQQEQRSVLDEILKLIESAERKAATV